MLVPAIAAAMSDIAMTDIKTSGSVTDMIIDLGMMEAQIRYFHIGRTPAALIDHLDGVITLATNLHTTSVVVTIPRLIRMISGVKKALLSVTSQAIQR